MERGVVASITLSITCRMPADTLLGMVWGTLSYSAGSLAFWLDGCDVLGPRVAPAENIFHHVKYF